MVVHFRHIVAEGDTLRQVKCEKCHRSFEYFLARRTVIDTLPFPPLIRQAKEICQKRLAKKLADDVEVVSCPACGWIQPAMSRELQRRFCKRLKTFGVFFAWASAVLAIVALAMACYVMHQPKIARVDVDWTGIGGAGFAGVAFGMLMIVVRWCLGRLRYPDHGFNADKPRGDDLLVTRRVAA